MNLILNRVVEILVRVGWTEQRDILNQVKDTMLYNILPKNIIYFLSSFGGLKIYEENCIDEINIFGVELFNNDNGLDDFKQIQFNSTENINIQNQHDEYYYSVLTGNQVYIISTLKENNNLMIDNAGNFYIHTFLNEFFWIANNPIEAFEQILFGCTNAIILNEERLEWMGRANEEIKYYPPINQNIKENPWG